MKPLHNVWRRTHRRDAQSTAAHSAAGAAGDSGAASHVTTMEDDEADETLTEYYCRQKGKKLNMVDKWDKISDALKEAGLFKWATLKEAPQKKVSAALAVAVGVDAVDGFEKELLDMLGIAAFKEAKVRVGAAKQRKAGSVRHSTNKKFGSGEVKPEPPEHNTMPVPRQMFVAAGIDGLPNGGTGQMTTVQLEKVTVRATVPHSCARARSVLSPASHPLLTNCSLAELCAQTLAIKHFIFKGARVMYGREVPDLVKRIADQILENIGCMPDRGKTPGAQRDLYEYLMTKTNNIRNAAESEDHVRYDDARSFTQIDLEDDAELAALAAQGAIKQVAAEQEAKVKKEVKAESAAEEAGRPDSSAPADGSSVRASHDSGGGSMGRAASTAGAGAPTGAPAGAVSFAQVISGMPGGGGYAAFADDDSLFGEGGGGGGEDGGGGSTYTAQPVVIPAAQSYDALENGADGEIGEPPPAIRPRTRSAGRCRVQ